MHANRNGLAAALLGLVVVGAASSARASIVVKDYWHLGEDGTINATDSVGGATFDGSVGTDHETPGITVNYASSAHGTSSLQFNRLPASGDGGGLYMGGQYVSVPASNWVLEISVKPSQAALDSYGGSVVTLGSDDGSYQIGLQRSVDGGGFFFGEVNQNFGTISSAATPNVWADLAWVREDDGPDGINNYFFINGVFIGTDSNTGSANGQMHLAVKPGNGEWFDGGLDDLRFSTFTGQFDPADLLTNSPPGVTPEPSIASLALIAATGTLARRRR